MSTTMMMIDRTSPTDQTYTELDAAYDYFNAALFDGVLPGCLMTLTRRRKSHGYFSPGRFCSSDGRETTDEIALNPMRFHGVETEEILATLVHEMCHQWQVHHGNPPKNVRYHDEEWAAKMEAIGLMPSDTGKPGGRRTGSHMNDYILDGGPFARACEARKFDRSRLFYDLAQE